VRIPKIKFTFHHFVRETAAAICVSKGGKEIWLPKSICADLVKGSKANGGHVNIAPFKWQELTGRVPQPLDTLELMRSEQMSLRYTTKPCPLLELPGKSPYTAQRIGIEAALKQRYWAFFCEMQTGKTIMSATVAYSRYKAENIDRCIIIAPLRTRKVWQAELPAELPWRFVPIEHFSHERLRYQIKLEANEQTMIIVDESHSIKNPNTERIKVIFDQTDPAGYRLILTGTPIGRHAGDLFFQFRFLHPEILGYDSYQKFSDAHLLYGGREGKKVVAYTNIELVSQRVLSFVFWLTREDMDRERPKERRIVDYIPSNAAAYVRLVSAYKEAYEMHLHRQVLKFTVRLQQAASGFVIDEKGQSFGYRDNGRMAALLGVMAEKNLPTIIYFRFLEEARSIGQKLNAPVLDGSTPATLFNQNIDSFNNGNIDVLIVNQQLAQGFNLRAAQRIIYYSTSFDLIARKQSEDRAQAGLGTSVEIIDLVAIGTIDQRILDVLAKKTDIATAFKQEVNEKKRERTAPVVGH